MESIDELLGARLKPKDCKVCGVAMGETLASLCDSCYTKAERAVAVSIEQALEQRAAETSTRFFENFRATLPQAYKDMLEKPYEREVSERLAAWAVPPTIGNVVLYGEAGVGKTHCAVHLAAIVAKGGLPTRYVSVPELSGIVRNLFHAPDAPEQDPRPKMRDCGLLILDDAHRTGDALGRTALEEIVFYRHARKRPMIVTINRHPKEMYKGSDAIVGDQALWSRILESGCIVERIESPRDRRLKP